MKKKILSVFPVVLLLIAIFTISSTVAYAANSLKITKQPVSVVALNGTTAKLTVSASGDGLTYKWYYKNKGASKYTLVSGKTEKTYTVKMKSSLDGRKMYCVVKDKYGNSVKSNVVTLTSGKTAKITKQPTSVTALNGTTAKLTVSATGDGLTYSWYYKNKGQSKYTLITNKKSKTYSVKMKSSLDGRKMYCVVKDKYGNSVKSNVVTLTSGKTAKITKQPVSVTADCGTTAKLTVYATGDGLTYSWYYKNKGQSNYTLITNKKSKTYSVKMKGSLDGRKMYCVVKDKYGNSVKSSVVTLTAEHVYDKGVVTRKATCALAGEKIYTCEYCSYKKTVTVSKTSHTMGSWKVMREPTVTSSGYERSSCTKCSYYKDRNLVKLTPVYFITVNLGDGETETVGVAKDGKYTLEVPERAGYNFVGWQNEKGKDFSSSGKITADTTVNAVWELDGTDTFAELLERTDAGVDTILITKDIVVTDTLFISDEVKIYSDGNFTLKRDPGFAGDIFVVGKDRNGTISTILGKKAVLTLGTGEGNLIIDGNRDNLKTTVKGSAIFVADSGMVNIYDGVEINNHKKLGNDRVLSYTNSIGESYIERTGGAAVAIVRGTVNMYGGAMKNNAVVTEYRIEHDAETNTDTYYETAGCGGAVFSYGNFNMTGGEISGNEALRGGGVYTATYAYLDAGIIENNISHSYGGAVSTSSGSNADLHIGTANGDKVMLIKDNYSLKAGGAVYSAFSAPIIVHGNTEFIGNHSDSSGGAIYTSGPLTVRDTEFEGNYCVYSGGAIYHQYNSAGKDRRLFTLSDSNFTENRGGLGGAVILSASDSVITEKDMGTIATITNCTFTKNQAVKTEVSAGNGGAIYVTRKADATISDCTFTENSASVNAGALAIHSGSDVTLPNCTFTGNSASFGGAMYASSESKVKVTDVTFTENSAVLTETGSGGLGGALYLNLTDITLSNVDMYRNSAAVNAGAVYQSNIELDIDSSCEFIGNSAGEHGGAFYLTYRTLEDGTKDGAVLNADSVLFKDNTAKAGGAISIRSAGHANLNNVQLINNSATGTGKNPLGGGAIYVGYGSLNLTDVTATGNSSVDFGGAVNAAGADVVVKGGSFSNNIALNGGAVNASDNSNLSFSGTTFTENEANYIQQGSYDSSLGGGAVNTSSGTLLLEEVTLDGNKSGYYGGAVLASKTQVTINNSTVKNSQGATGAALYFKSGCTTTITDTAVTDNKSSANGVLYTSGGTLDMTNVTATGNEAYSGGVLFFSGTSTVVTLNDSTWNGNSAKSTGGTAHFKDGTFNVNNSQITGNSAKLGGAFYSEKGTVNVKKSAFDGNSATQNGGAIDIVGTTANISEDTTFTSNTAVSHGGAVYVNYIKAVAATETTPAVEAVYGVLNVEGGTFSGNSAVGGGAVSVRTGGNATFNGTVFEGNKSEGHDGENDGNAEGGGAIYVGYGTVNLNNVTAKDNETVASVFVNDDQEEKLYGFGGFLDGYQAKVYVEGGTVSGNKAPSGGAFSILGSGNVLSVNGTTFTNNESTYDNSVDYDNNMGGGAINIKNATITIKNAAFDGNKTGWYGGTVNASKSTVTIDNITVKNSKGKTGSALHFKSGCNTTITNSEITDNLSGYNGVVYANGGTLNMEKVTAENNQATNGGVLFTSGNSTVVTLKDSNFKNNNASSGGAVYVTGAKTVIDNCQITDNTAANGGAVYTEYGNVEVINGTILSGNTVSSTGGAVFAKLDATVTVKNAKINNNTASGNGGGILMTSNSELSVEDSEICYNASGNHGGGIVTTGTNATVSGTTVLEGNTAKKHGGAVYVVYFTPEATEGEEKPENIGGTFTMTSGEIKNNSALGGGAVSIRTGCEATLTGTVISGNTAEGYADNNDGDGEGGGAIYVGFGTVNLNDVTLTNNEAKATAVTTEGGEERLLSYGGAIDAYKGVVNISGCSFGSEAEDGTYIGNKAAAGGAIYARNKSEVTINGAKFLANQSTYVQGTTYDSSLGGGAVNIEGGKLTITGSTFDGNTSTYYGGAILADACEVNISDDTESGNKTVFKNSEGGTGAAIYFKNGTVANLTNVNLNNNNSSRNGVVYANSSQITMNSVIATENHASSGGVIYVSNTSTVVEMNKCEFTKNTATSGGVAFTENATLKFNECNISDNVTSGSGGAIYSKEGIAEIVIDSCEVNNNTGKYGGVLYSAPGSRISVIDTKFTENDATVYGGVFYVSKAISFDIADSTFDKNYSVSNGGAIYVHCTNTSLDGSIFRENSSDSHGGAINNIGSVINAHGNNTFISNKSANHGGAIYLTYVKGEAATDSTPATPAIPGVLNMTGGLFEKNSAFGGGAISVRTGCEANLTDIDLKANVSEGYADDNDGDGESGGAIYVGYGTVNLTNVIATDNEAKAAAFVNEDNVEKLYSYGGVVNSFKSTVTLSGGTYTGNEAAAGGVIFAQNNSVVSITGSTFIDNESTYVNDYDNTMGGGAIAITGGELTVSGATFDGNKSDYYGGTIMAGSCEVNIGSDADSGTKTVIKDSQGGTGAAIYLKNSANASITETELTDNTSSFNGVVYIGTGNLEMSKVTATGNYAPYGAVLYVSGANTTSTVTECSFTGNSSKTQGGAVYVKEATATIKDSTFEKNTSALGGAVYLNLANVTLENSVFTSNTASSNGGAIDIVGATVTAKGTNKFTSNSATNHGGAVYVTYSDVTVNEQTTRIPGVLNMTDGSFEGNTAMGGGAVSVRSSCEANFTNTSFTGNIAEGNDGNNNGDGEGGGAIYVGFGTVNLTNVTATGNETKASSSIVNEVEKFYGYGGVIDAYKSTVTVNGGTFSENRAPSGGVIYGSGNDSISFTGAKLENNKSNYEAVDYVNTIGGGAMNIVGGKLTISGTTLDGNSSSYYGGTILANSVTVTIGDKSVISNSDGATGSALSFINSCVVEITDSSVTDNVASKSGSGVVYFAGSTTATLKNVTFSGNKNNNGGVIYTSGSGNVTIEDSAFTSNIAKNIGGAIDFRSSGKLTAKGTTFTGNTAKNAGAVHTGGAAKAEIENCTFTSNGATEYGGAIGHESSGSVNVTDSTFENNTATSSGGAVYAVGTGLMTIKNCSFKTNTAASAGGVYADKGASVTVEGGAFDSNSATSGDGGAIVIADSTTTEESNIGTAATTLTLTNVSFNSNTATGKGGALSTDGSSPNLVIKATGCKFDSNSSTGAGAGAVEIMNGNQTTADDPTELKIVFKDCEFTNNTAKTTGGAVEIRSCSAAKFDGITAKSNVAPQNGGVIYVTSNYSRVYITGSIVSSDNSANGSVEKGTLVHLYDDGKYSNPPTLYTTASEDADWLSQVAWQKDKHLVSGMTQMP